MAYENIDPDIESCRKYIENALSNPRKPAIRIRVEEGDECMDTTTNDPLTLRAILAVLPKLNKYDALVEVSEREGVRITVPDDLPPMAGTGIYLKMDTVTRGKRTNLSYTFGRPPTSQPDLFKQSGERQTFREMQEDLERRIHNLF